jgi:outer membrane protein OmpA-like peptidoglycan-associated protein
MKHAIYFCKKGVKKMKKSNLVILLLCVFAVSLLAGCATPPRPILAPKAQDTSWWGSSGAQLAPVKDVQPAKIAPPEGAQAIGSWWMPNQAPAGENDAVWGNRGYVYLSGEAPKPVVVLPAPPKLKIQDVYFPFDSAELTPVARKTLDNCVKALKDNPRVEVVLMGYASPEGTDEYNLKLSGRRALAVKEYLVKGGIEVILLSTEAKGEMEVEESAYPSARMVHFEIVNKISN